MQQAEESKTKQKQVYPQRDKKRYCIYERRTEMLWKGDILRLRRSSWKFKVCCKIVNKHFWKQNCKKCLPKMEKNSELKNRKHKKLESNTQLRGALENEKREIRIIK